MASLEEVELGVELGFDEKGCLGSLCSGIYILKLGSMVMLEFSDIQTWFCIHNCLCSATGHSWWVWWKLGYCWSCEKPEADEEGDKEENVRVFSEE